MQIKDFWLAQDRGHRRVKRVGLIGLIVTLGIGAVLVGSWWQRVQGDPALTWYLEHLDEIQVACGAAGYERIRPERRGGGLVLEAVGAGDRAALQQRLRELGIPPGVALSDAGFRDPAPGEAEPSR